MRRLALVASETEGDEVFLHYRNLRGGRVMTITIRRARPDDAAAIARMMDDPAVYPGLMQMPFNTSVEAHRARLTDNLAPGKLDLSLVAERDGEIVGSAGLHPVGPAVRRRHVDDARHLGRPRGASARASARR